MDIIGERARTRNDIKPLGGPVLYWMQREQRVDDNWALVKAQQLAREKQEPLLVLFNISKYHGAKTQRHYEFMIAGLIELQEQLAKLNISFWVTEGEPEKSVVDFITLHNIGQVVSDFNPLRFVEGWKKTVAEKITISFIEVDAHNIVPCWVASDKQEYAAYTFRPKIHKQLSKWLQPIPSIKKHPFIYDRKPKDTQWKQIKKDVDQSVAKIDWLIPGTKAGKKLTQKFISEKITNYAEQRNDPNKSVISNLSPYLRYGHISAQWLALEVSNVQVGKDNKEAFLEELIVRRELADNFCFYNREYDKVSGAHPWAQKTIEEHVSDKREYVYTKSQFESAKTHDGLWNAMQVQMTEEGKMHGWCRMYWAKKILEWTPDTQTAIDIALYLNDKYELDGTDPNGCVGVMWSICGVHDRAWNERPIFGKIRYMNFNGAKRKFDVQSYIDKYSEIQSLF